MTTAIKTLQDKLNILSKNGFLGESSAVFDFLNVNSCPCERAIEDYCARFLSDKKLLGQKWTGRREPWFSSKSFLEYVEDGQLVEALWIGIHGGNCRSCVTECELMWIFCGSVVSEYCVPDENEALRDNLFDLATSCWVNYFPRNEMYYQYRQFRIDFLRERSSFRKYADALQRFVRDNETRHFLREDDNNGPAPARNPKQRFTRVDSVDTVWNLSFQTKIFLDNREDFPGLLRRVKEIWDNPRKVSQHFVILFHLILSHPISDTYRIKFFQTHDVFYFILMKKFGIDPSNGMPRV